MDDPGKFKVMDEGEFQVLIVTKLEHIEHALKEAARLTDQTRTRLYGNGVPGLIEEVSELRQDVKTLRESMVNRDKLATWLGGLIIALVVGLLWAIFTGEIQIVRVP